MESTPNPQDTLWTVEFTFHGAKSVPVADIPGFSSDPFLACFLSVPAHPQHGDDDPLEFRTPTVRHTLNPTWDAKWRVAGIPSTGFKLTLRLRDEDPGDHDDRLGTVVVREHTVNENLQYDNKEYNVQKRRGSIRAYMLTYIASAISKNISIHARLYMSIKVIGKTPNQKDRRVYTVGPHWWSVHYSPMIGRLTGTRGPNKEDVDPNKPGKSVATFQANKLQLGGPVPAELKHHYVGYRPFITWLFTQKGLRGRILHYGLKRQYSMVYYYSKSTETGVVGVTSDDEADKGEEETLEKQIATRFLEMCHWGEGGRLYTYIITLDGEWHFTETGPEFAIDMLSKHSMHSNVAPDIAYSGEFFVQELDAGESPDARAAEGSSGEHRDDAADGHGERHERPATVSSTRHTANSKIRPRYPKDYELIIDNDSGTYRPKKELLPVFEKWLSSPECLGGLGRVRAMDGFDETLKGMKEQRASIKADIKKKRGEPDAQLVQATSSISSGHARELGLGRSGSISSSDVDDLVEEARKKEVAAEHEHEGGGGNDDAVKEKQGQAKEAEGKVEAAKEAT